MVDTNPDNSKYSSYWLYSTRPKIWDSPKFLSTKGYPKTGPCNPVGYTVRDQLSPITIYVPTPPSPYGTRNLFYNSLNQYSRIEP